jgi:predicted DNA-binding protein
MSNQKELSRLTSDIPKEYHLKIKSIALLTGKTIRDVLMNAIDAIDMECITSTHIPNKVTRKVLEEIKEGKNLIRGKEAEKITKKLGL